LFSVTGLVQTAQRNRMSDHDNVRNTGAAESKLIVLTTEC